MIKRFFINGLLFSVSLIIGLLLAEGVLRVLPSSITNINKKITYTKDEFIGFKFESNSVTSVSSSCFDTKVSANSLGFRGEDWTELGGIAVFGDSFMEAIQVNDNETLSYKLSEIFNMPVYNAGLSSFGTVAEFVTYRSYVKRQKPKIVVLSMFENDVLDNHCATSQVGDGLVSKSCATISSTTVSINSNYYSTHGNSALRSKVKKYCLTCNLARSFLLQLKSRAKNDNNVGENTIENSKSNGEGSIDDEAWQITKDILRQFKSEVESDGARLVVMVIPDQIAFMSTTTKFTSEKLVSLANEEDVDVIDLYEPMKNYVSEQKLSYPFFSFECDGHWNPLGHFLVANFLSKYLIEKNVIDFDPINREKLLHNIDNNLKQSPETILGVEKYRLIYSK